MLRYCEALWHKVAVAPKNGSQAPEKQNPFLPPEPELTLASLGSTHKLIFNKYCVVPLHTLIISNQFVPQTAPLNLDDFGACAEATRIVRDTPGAETEGWLLFYNSGEHSGATQPHRHVQMIPGDNPPITASFDGDQVRIFEGRLYGLVHLDCHGSQDLGLAWHTAYRSLTSILPSPNASYSLVFTRKWMLLVPRRNEFYDTLSFNALTFAGYFLACSPQDLHRLCHHVDPLGVITAVTFPCPQWQ